MLGFDRLQIFIMNVWDWAFDLRDGLVYAYRAEKKRQKNLGLKKLEEREVE